MSESTIIFPEKATSSPGFNRFESLVTPADIKRRYLHGVDTRDNANNELPDDVYQFAVDAAISLLEHDLEITINPTQYIDERHDYKSEDYWNWGFLQLQHKPVISVEAIGLKVVENPNRYVTFPQEWVRLSHMNGHVQIAPTAGTIGEFNLGQTMFLPRLLIFNSTYPSFWSLDYTAGFERNKLPALINQVIGILASLDIFNIAGDLILGAGIAATSIGIDGLSESITSTASAENTAYGARIALYNKQLKYAMKVLRRYYGKTVKHVIC